MKKEQIAPKTLNKTGINLIQCGMNSESIIKQWSGYTNKAFPQKEEPKPIKASRKSQPTNSAPKLRINKGKDIAKGDSCAVFIIGLNEFVSLKKVRYNSRIE